MKHLFFFILLSTLLSVSCYNGASADAQDQDRSSADNTEEVSYGPTRISGTLTGVSERPVYLEYLTASKMVGVDTVMTDDQGNFEFETQITYPGYYRVSLNESNMCILIVHPEDKIEVQANGSDIYQSYEVSGSEESQRLKDLNRMLIPRDSINMAYQNAQIMRDQKMFEEVMANYEGIMAEVNTKLKSFIDENLASLSALAAVQNMDMETEFPTYLKVVESLEGKMDQNEFYQAIRIQVMAQRRLAIGSPAPEITLPQPNGQDLSLSDLKGKYVLIDFWASWCGPCRKENPNVVRVYEKYHDMGFEILGVSLDQNQKAWLNAIEQDGLRWKHVSDLKYWGSAVVPEYQIKGIPLTYLVDPEGNIIGKNLRGASLEQKLAEIFD